MPYKSAAQRGYLHAKHPEIAARWDKEIRAKRKKGKVAKSKKALAAGIGTATIGGALANQVPSAEEVRRRRKKGQIKKMLVPTSTDPDFNQEAAQKAFDLVMKMDDDTAEVFCHIVVSDYFEETVEKNLGTLQRHLNETLAGQLEDLKKAHLRLVSKGMDSNEAVAYAQAITLIEKQLNEPFSKVGAAQKYGYQWEESDFRRDPSTGQFRTKITHTQTSKIKNKTFKSITGIDTPEEIHGNQLKPEDQIRFQDEYRQLAGFLDAVNESTGGKGNQSVMLHYRDMKTGKNYAELHFGRKPPIDQLADPSTRLMGVDAKPTALTAGGAAFGLATALGGGMNPQQVQAINNIEGGSGRAFTDKWLQSGDQQNSNAKLYGRLAASGEFLSATGLGPKAVMAGKFAQIVGSAGPQAEMVLGPTARKTAYRYRGTEKTPERAMGRAYSQGVEQGKVYGLQAETEEHGVKEPRRAPKHGPTPSLQQMVQDRAQATGRAPTWDERELGRRAVVDHLRQKMPKKQLYELQLAAGNTPPSEGVIINAEGQLVTQAVGYGDDHYLPFNLKNLKGLKGGEYIRTRSVGGLTSEDIYTGLISGARQVTVTSRSGTYTMTFEPDFRGGRRHSDKARRMTRRYEQLLDAVQSQQVDRTEIDPLMRAEIEREVKEEMSGPGWTRRDIQDAIREKEEEFKSHPYITEQDEKRAEAIISSRAANASEAERTKIRSQVMDDLMDQKEVKFRLNSAGYKAAVDALKEQFPYYIAQARWVPPKDADKKIDTSVDRGYVEPGRNRPTAAAAGLFGVTSAGKFAGKGGKFSAREADYQGARKVGGGRLEPTIPETPSGDGAQSEREVREEKAAIRQMEYKVSEVGAKIQESAKINLEEIPEKHQAAINYTADEIRDPVKQKKFQAFVDDYTGSADVRRVIGAEQDKFKREWEQAIGFRERKPFDRGTAQVWPKHPPTFEGAPYRPGADQTKVLRELDKVDVAGKAGLINGLPYSHLSDKEQEAEHHVLSEIRYRLTDSPGIPVNPRDLEKLNVDPQSPGLAGGILRDPDKVVERIENLQRSRALLANLSDDARTKRASGSPAETKEVVHNPTPPAADSPHAKALAEAQEIAMVRMGLEREKNTDQTEYKLVRDLSDTLRATADQLTSPTDLDNFKRSHQREWATYEAAKQRLSGRG